MSQRSGEQSGPMKSISVSVETSYQVLCRDSGNLPEGADHILLVLEGGEYDNCAVRHRSRPIPLFILVEGKARYVLYDEWPPRYKPETKVFNPEDE